MKDEGIHPALKKETKVVQLRTVPADLHLRLVVGAHKSNKTIEQFIIDTLDATVAQIK